MSACLPLFLPYILVEGSNFWKRNFLILAEFLSGRLAAYLIFAVIASLIGKTVELKIPGWILPSAMILSAVGMLSYLAFSNVFLRDKCGISAHPGIFRRIPLVLGFLTGINACPPFITGFVRLLDIADVFNGLFYFSGFFISTSLFMVPLILPTPWLNERVKSIGRIALFLSGLWYLFLGIGGLF